MKKWKKGLSLLLAFVMLIGLVPVNVWAMEGAEAQSTEPETTTYVRVNGLDEIVPNVRYIIVGTYTNPDTNVESYHLMGTDYRTVGGFHYSYAQDQDGAHYFDISQDLNTITAKNYSSILKVRLRPYRYYSNGYYFEVDDRGYLCGWSSATNQGTVGHDAHSCMPIYKYTYNTCGDAWWYLRMPEEGDYVGDWQIVSRCHFRVGGRNVYYHDIMQFGAPYPNSGGQFRAEEVYTRDVGEIEDSERIQYTVDKDTNIWLYREVCSHKSSDVTHTAPTLATCSKPGNLEYWYCKGCETYSASADFTEVIRVADTFIPATVHTASCGHSGVDLKFELYTDSSMSSSQRGERYILIGKAGEKCYAMGNRTNADGSRNAVEVTLDANGIITANSNAAEFLTYDWSNGGVSGFIMDDGYFSALDGKVFSYDQALYNASGYIPVPARFYQSDSETGLGAFASYSVRDPADEYIVFDAESLTFKAQSTESDTTYLYRELCPHQKDYFPSNDSSCTRCGNVEYWYCDTCWKYFGASDGSITLDWSQLNTHASGHSYVDGSCENCSKKVPVYTKVTSEDQLGLDGTYIIVASDGTNHYVLKQPINREADLNGNGIFDVEEKDEDENGVPDVYETDLNGNEIPDIDEWEYVDPAIPVMPNNDGSISVLGLDAAEFEMIEFAGYDYGEEIPEAVSEDSSIEAESDKYYFYLINGVLNGLNKPSTRFACYPNGGVIDAMDETNVWGVSLGNGLTAQEQRELSAANFDVLFDTAVMYAENCGNGATRPLRLRIYDGKINFISEYDGYLEGAEAILDEEGNNAFDENGNYLYKTNDAQFGVNLYYAPNEYSHIHSWSDWEKVDENSHERTCSVSGCPVVCETKPHDWNRCEETKTPGCDEEGELTYTCTSCGATKKEVIPKNGHVWSDWSYENADLHKRRCTKNCGVQEETETHGWNAWQPKDENEHERSCSGCGSSVSEPHKWDAGEETKKPTDLEEGITTYTCTECQKTKEESIPKLPHTHSYGDWNPTLGDDTTHTRECPCEDTQTLPHNFDEGSVINWATHIAPGQMIYTCTDCGYFYYNTIPALPEHEWGAWQVNPEDEATHFRSCACQASEILPHNYGTPVVTEEPTTEAEGEKSYVCADCGHTKKEKIDAIEPITPTEEIKTKDETASLTVPEGSTATVDKNAILTVETYSEDEKKQLEEKSEEKIVSLLGEGKEIVVGYDVSLLMDDVPVQPSGKVLITLPFFASDYPYSDLVVVYIDDEGNTTLCETITTSEGYIAFYTDHFSTYAVVGKPSYVKGDLDSDGDVDLDDAIYLLYQVNFPAKYPLNQNGDLDHSGNADLDDAIYLLYHVNFPAKYPLS